MTDTAALFAVGSSTTILGESRSSASRIFSSVQSFISGHIASSSIGMKILDGFSLRSLCNRPGSVPTMNSVASLPAAKEHIPPVLST